MSGRGYELQDSTLCRSFKFQIIQVLVRVIDVKLNLLLCCYSLAHIDSSWPLGRSFVERVFSSFSFQSSVIEQRRMSVLSN